MTDAPSPATAERPAARVRPRVRTRTRRFATTVAFATLFCAGASLSALAGDALVDAVEAGDSVAAPECDEATVLDPEEEATAGVCPETPRTETGETGIDAGSTTPVKTEPERESGAEDPDGGGEPAGESADSSTPEEDGTDEPPADEPGTDDESSPESSKGGERSAAPRRAKGNRKQRLAGPPLVAPHGHEVESQALDPEANAAGSVATVWLHRTLSDPIRPATRLTPAFARQLVVESKGAGVSWALVLGVLRAEGRGERVPATRARLREVASALAPLAQEDEWRAVLALRGRTGFADRVIALTRYNRAAGLRALVIGLEAAKAPIAKRVLADERITIYPGGRADIEAGRIDVRVLVLLRYLAEAHDQVTVSSLQTGHRFYSRPGVVSMHMYGLAVDIAALGDSPIAGNSQPGGVTEQGVRNILLLPRELQPRQVISLLGLGGPSFPMANHWDHIHVGF